MSRKAVIVVCLAAICLPVLSSPAAAQVSIVPDQGSGGSTQTFAFRLADKRPDTSATRLELVFPQAQPIAFVKVDPAPGWTATVRPRPLNPPVAVAGKTLSEVAGSVVVEGGSVAPGEFEQFLVTMGPLPANGTLAFEATETFANGAVQHWTGAQVPTITLGTSAAAAGVAPSPAAAAQDQPRMSAAPAGQAVQPAAGSSGGLPFAVLWGALGLGALVIIAVWWRASARKARAAAQAEDRQPEVSAK